MEKNKSVGIISLYYHNYNCGGLLQAAALCEVLHQLGYEAEQICFERSRGHKARKSFSQKIIYHLREKDFLKTVRLKIATKFHPDYRQDFTKAFTSFENLIPHSQKIYTEENIGEAAGIYDIFITGSDQVWSWQFKSIEILIVSPILMPIFLISYLQANIRFLMRQVSLVLRYLQNYKVFILNP